MDKQRLLVAGINCDTGLKRFNGNEEMFLDVLKQFLQDTHFSQMLFALEAGDNEAAFVAAHALKGIAANLSMNSFLETLCSVVEALRREKCDQLAQYLPKLEQQYEQICKAIQEQLG